MSFDRQTGDLWVATNGQQLWEAVYVANEPGNYGWNRLEGSHCFDPSNPGSSPPDDACERQDAYGDAIHMPVLEYPHPGNRGDHSIAGVSVIGGYVYRGDAMEALQGRYVFGDWAQSLFVATRDADDDGWNLGLLSELDAYLLGFGEDSEGELYLLTSETSGPTGRTGAVHKLVPAR